MDVCSQKNNTAAEQIAAKKISGGRVAVVERSDSDFKNTRTPPVEAHRLVVTYLLFPIQVCFPCNDHAQPATRTSHRSVCRHAQTTPSQPQLRRPYKAPMHFRGHRQPCEINSSIDIRRMAFRRERTENTAVRDSPAIGRLC